MLFLKLTRNLKLVICVFLCATFPIRNCIQLQHGVRVPGKDDAKKDEPTRKPTIHFNPRNPLWNTSTYVNPSRNPTYQYIPYWERNASHALEGPLTQEELDRARLAVPDRVRIYEPDGISMTHPDDGVSVKINPFLEYDYFAERKPVSFGLVLPLSNFRRRKYQKEIAEAFSDFREKSNSSILIRKYDFKKENAVVKYMEASSSPTTILSTLCDDFLRNNVSAILYLFNMETFGRSTASVQYFFQLASYLGLPVISWNADNSGLERRASNLQLQLAPSVEHQATAMLSILRRYSWPKFAIVTTQIAGHYDFIQAVRDVISQSTSDSGQQFTIMDTVIINNPEQDIRKLISSEARILFLYSTRMEAANVLKAATDNGLTGKNYLWIVTQSVIQSLDEAPQEFPVGMLGVHFGTTDDDMISEIKTAIKVFASGVRNFIAEEEANRKQMPDLTPSLSCRRGNAIWQGGANLYRYLRAVKINPDSDKKKPSLEFNPDGTRKFVQLKIMNLRPNIKEQNVWEEIGVWNSAQENGLEVKDIVWPGYSHVPPNGIPEKFHLRITFMEEPPFINMDPPNPLTGTCTANKGVLCRIATDEMMQGVNVSWAVRNSSYYQCCSGFCIDLLAKFSEDLGFSYDFFRVEDGIWGAIVNGKWTGLPGAIINGKADMIMTSIKINSEREEILDFSIPFLDTGITIVVKKRTGIISPTAFLEPFDGASWMLVAAVAVQVAAISIFIFEWLSPTGFNMRFQPPSGQRFSLLRTLWLVWAILFQAAVNIDVPRSVTGRLMGNVWAMFALIFLAIYTANLAAFMITREEFYDLSGVEDKRLQNPTSMKPPFRFGTTPLGNTDVVLKKSFPEMHSYMRSFNQSSAIAGVKKVKRGELDAFLYDATVLEYLTGQDDECRLLTVGSWYAFTGYGVAFRRHSKYVPLFNDLIMQYRESGYLERLSRFWFTGACQSENQYKSASEPLSLEQFMSTFVLLGCGVILGFIILTAEHLYFKRIRFSIASWNCTGFFSLISMSMGDSLHLVEHTSGGNTARFSDSVRRTPCENPICSMQLWKLKHDLDFARLRLYYLEEQLIATGIWKASQRTRKKVEKGTNTVESADIISDLHAEDVPNTFQKSPRLRPSNSLPPDESFHWERRKRAIVNPSGSSKSDSRINPLRRRDFTIEHVTTTELIRQPLLDPRDFDFEMAEIETVL